MHDAASLLHVYDTRLRGASEVGSAAWSQPHGPLWLARYGDHGLVTYTSLAGASGAEIDALLADVAALFRQGRAGGEVTEWEWKTRSHDGPADLADHLDAAGLVPEEVETVMLGEAAHLAALPADLPDGLRVLRADVGPDRATWLGRAAALQREVFGRGPTAEEVVARLDRHNAAAADDADETAGLWVVATDDDAVVAAGRPEVVAGTGCAGLWGGAVHPDHRGRGAYRALVAARAAWAVEHDVEHLHSDCTAMSRPILERAGLVAVTTSTPWVAQVRGA